MKNRDYSLRNKHESNALIEYLPRDSEQLEIPCALIDLTNIIDNETESLQSGLSDSLNNNPDITFITIKLVAKYPELLNYFIKMGAELIDTEIMYVHSGDERLPCIQHDSFSFEFLDRIDSRLFVSLADEMLQSRFYKDRHITYSMANKLWRESIKNHCEGFADELLVVFHKGDPCGLITLRIEEERNVYLHIIGVLRKWQRRKIGSMMLQKVLTRYSDHHKIFVETQSDNLASQMCYQANGFVLYQHVHIIHLWR